MLGAGNDDPQVSPCNINPSSYQCLISRNVREKKSKICIFDFGDYRVKTSWSSHAIFEAAVKKCVRVGLKKVSCINVSQQFQNTTDMFVFLMLMLVSR